VLRASRLLLEYLLCAPPTNTFHESGYTEQIQLIKLGWKQHNQVNFDTCLYVYYLESPTDETPNVHLERGLQEHSPMPSSPRAARFSNGIPSLKGSRPKSALYISSDIPSPWRAHRETFDQILLLRHYRYGNCHLDRYPYVVVVTELASITQFPGLTILATDRG